MREGVTGVDWRREGTEKLRKEEVIFHNGGLLLLFINNVR